MKQICVCLMTAALLAQPLWAPVWMPATWAQENAVISQASPEHPLRLAVLPFQYLGNDSEQAWLSLSLAESLTTAFSQSKHLLVIERNQISNLLREQSFQHSAWAKPETAPELGTLLGADLLVLGSYHFEGEILHVQARLVNVHTGQVEAGRSVHISGRADALAELQQNLAHSILAKLNIAPQNSEAQLAELLTVTSSPRAYALYHKALQGIHNFSDDDLSQAIAYLEEAIVLDPNYTQAYVLLAEALSSRALYPELFREAYPEDLERALGYVEQALKTGKHLAAVYRALAQVYVARRNWSEAKSAIEQALRLNIQDHGSIVTYLSLQRYLPDTDIHYLEITERLKAMGADLSNPWIRLSLADLLLDPRYSFQSQERVHLEHLLAGLRRDLPNNAFVRLHQAKLAMLTGDPEGTLREAQAGVALSPNHSMVYFMAGYILFESAKEHPEHWLHSRGFLERALDLNPNLTYAYSLLGLLLAEHGHTQEAQAVMKKGYQQTPNSSLLPYFLGDYAAAAKRYPEAYAYYHQAIANRGNFLGEKYDGVDLELSLLETCFHLQKNAEAQALSQQLIQKQLLTREQDFRKLIYLHLLYDRQDKAHERAAALFQNYRDWKVPEELNAEDLLLYRHIYLRQALKREPNNPAILNDIAQLALVKGQLTEAKDYLLKAQSLAPENPSIWFNLGLLYLKAENYPEAESALRQCLALQAEHPKARFNLGRVLERQQRYAEARKIWEAHLLQYPNDRQTLDALSQLPD